jgi:hypothetical protein
MFEKQRALFISVAGKLDVRLPSLNVWQETCFAQILTENETYDGGLHRDLIRDWARAMMSDGDAADRLVDVYWSVRELRQLFTPAVSPRKAALAAVREHLAELSLPDVGKVRWVSLDGWREEKLSPVWLQCYDALDIELRTHGEDQYDLWRQMAFAHVQNISEPQYGLAYKWARPIWVKAMWDAMDGWTGAWQSLTRVLVAGYLPVGLAADGKAFIVASRALP